MSERVREILGWYGSDNPGTLTNLARILNHGRLAGTGRLVILPVDQGFEHGPARSFAINPAAYDPRYHFQLAIESGCSAYAAPLGFLEAGAREFAGEVPLILKVNDHDALQDEKDPTQALTGSIADALRLGCAGIGFTIYPGSTQRLEMYQQIRAYAEEAKRSGLVVIIWAYPRGSSISKTGETAIDVCGYAAHLAAQLGAHIIKVKIPTAHVEHDEARKVYEKEQIPVGSLPDRIRHIVQCCFDGRRVVIFSGGAAGGDAQVLEEIRGIHAGGGFGSIIGRNAFQRKKAHALELLATIMNIYAGQVAPLRASALARESLRSMAPEIRILAESASLHRAAADEFARRAKQAVQAHGRFAVALSGGTTPRGLYAHLASDQTLRREVPWKKVHFFWGDERHVPPDHPDSNFRMAHEVLLAKIPVPSENIHRIPTGNPDVDEVARQYEETLRAFFQLSAGHLPRFDLVLLGLGSDGHTASLFPGTRALHEKDRLVVANWVARLHSNRITVTVPGFNNASCVIFLVSGEDKALPVKAVVAGRPEPDELPAALIRPTDGELVWLVDRAAGRLLNDVGSKSGRTDHDP